jgi:hypothetical protein
MKKVIYGIGAVIVVIIILAAAGSKTEKSEKAEIATGSEEKTSSKGIKLLANFIYDDAKVALTNGESLLSVEQALELSGIAYKVTSDQYSNDFNENEIAADNKYKDKRILIVGKIDSINKDIAGRGYLSLKTGGRFNWGMQAHLSLVGEEEAASLKRGDTVYLVCDPAMKIGPIPGAKNCTQLPAYLNEGERFRNVGNDFLNGTKKFPEKFAEAMIVAYVIGDALPDESSCFKSIDEECSKALEALPKASDKEKKKIDEIANRLGVAISHKN